MNLVGKPLWVIGHRATILETTADFGMVEIITAPDVPGPPPHHHPDFSEWFYVADGTLEVEVDGAWRRLEQGQALSVSAGAVHTFRNPGTRPTMWLTGFSPRGFERFFAAFGVPADRSEAQAASTAPEMFERLGREAASYGMIIN